MHVLLALLLLGVLIMAHEAGHFWAARACGIDVQEFSMGMGPLLLQRRSKRGTLFSLRLLPIGGFCQFYGEDQEVTDARCFNNYPVWKRAVTVASGPLMNFAVALVVIVLYLSAIGLMTVVPRVAEVEENAMEAGLMVGDELLSVNGVDILSSQDVTQAIADSQGEAVTLSVERDGQKMDIVLTPFYDEEAGRYRVGFTFALTVMGIICEFLGSGSIFGAKIMDFKIGAFATPAGSFLVYGICIALFVYIMDSIERMRRERKNRPLTRESLVQEVA